MDWREWAAVYLKGAFMGAADTVPGVSGGTIALITGIYERLIEAITSLDPRVLEHVPRLHTAEGRAALYAELWEMDVPFLLVLGAGMVTSVVALSSVMHWAVTTPAVAVPTFAFFSGLIAASAVVLYRYVSTNTLGRVAAGVVGFAVAFVVAGVAEGGAGTEPSTALVFLAGSVAISAMVLPGVSGAFILLLFGLYTFMSDIPRSTIEALLAVANGGDLAVLVEPGVPLVTFLAGAAVGLFTVAHAVGWALDHYREATLTFLIALMVGALRAPLDRIRTTISETLAAWTVETVGLAAAAALAGAVLVLALDYFTDDLEY